jgi:exodeoxyribonuclease-3
VDILKIATFNINGIRSRLPALLEWLERERPDVVCLQELKAPDAAFPMGDVGKRLVKCERCKHLV